MTTTACDDQFAADPNSREAAIEAMAREVQPHEWRQGGAMRYQGHLITWGEYVQRRRAIAEGWHKAQDDLADAWDAGEKRIDRIAQSDASGDHYAPTAAEILRAGLGHKEDAIKPRLDLLVEGMPRALEEVAMVLTFGSQKYADHNWQHVDRAPQRYLAAGMRHELALATGETHDPETGAHHLAHKLCCDLFRLELALRGEEATCR